MRRLHKLRRFLLGKVDHHHVDCPDLVEILKLAIELSTRTSRHCLSNHRDAIAFGGSERQSMIRFES